MYNTSECVGTEQVRTTLALYSNKNCAIQYC